MKRCLFLITILSVCLGNAFTTYVYNMELRLNKCSISQLNLIKDSKYYWENGNVLFRDHVELFSSTDTLKSLAIRVEFQLDEDEETTGNGSFDLSSPSEPLIDPPPHDRSYFENQITALSNYYWSVSNGKLLLQGEVTSEVIRLPRKMGDYNPGTTDEAVDRGLAELFRDAISLADSAGYNFSKYDCFIVFHAGAGRDIDLGYDPTPRDIPSAFLNLEDLRNHLEGGDPLYEGIEVENGQYHIKEGIILPETENQEGYEIGLLGTMTIMLGFQIGLPALWDTETGRSGIGKWGLMDQGSGNYNGLIPAEPCAWSKIFLGWETPIEIIQGTNLEVACSRAVKTKKIYKIPINDHEYFLIENRLYDTNGDSLTLGWDSSGNEITFLSNGQIQVFQPGVIVRVEEYDYGLPGSGILIWHIDEKIIEEKFKSNSVNSDKNHRGVDLEEADGAQDIGESYGFLSGGAGSEAGVLHDAWFKNNEINLLVNNFLEVAFTPLTYPNSRSNSGANSHVVISDFSETDTVMTFSVRNDFNMEGFPVDFGEDQTPYPPLFGDLDGDRETEIVVATREGKIYAWNKDGTNVILNDAKRYRVSVSSILADTIWFHVALFADAGSEITAPPAMSDLNGDNFFDIIFAPTADGKIIGFTAKDDDSNGLADKVLEWDVDSENLTSLVLTHNEIITGTEDGKVYGMSYPEEVIWRQDLESGSITGICQYGIGNEKSFITTTKNGKVFRIQSGGSLIWQLTILEEKTLSSPSSFWSLRNQEFSYIILKQNSEELIIDGMSNEKTRFGDGILPTEISGAALGDLDSDGFIENTVTADGQLWCFNHNGSISNNFPVPFYKRELILSSPLLGDIDEDEEIDIILMTSEGNIEAYSNTGIMIEGFPLTAGGTTAVSPAILDLDNDGDTEIAAVSDRGFLFVWDLPSKYESDNVPWGSFLSNPAHSGMYSQYLTPEEPGKDLMPMHLVYNYPNPTQGDFTTIRYRLEYSAQVWIKIFDMAGELIDEFSGPGEAQTENEVVWLLTDVGSGVYFCQVRATGNNEENIATFKIAVVK